MQNCIAIFFGIGSGGAVEKHNRPPKNMAKKKKEKQKTPHRSTVAPCVLKLDDACAFVGGVSKSTLRRAVKRGLLTPSQPSRVWLFEIDDLRRYVRDGKIRFDFTKGDPQARAAKYEEELAAKEAENGDAE
jgi:hypothetical protein